MSAKLVVRAASLPGDHIAEAFTHAGNETGEIVKLTADEALMKGQALLNIGLAAKRGLPWLKNR